MFYIIIAITLAIAILCGIGMTVYIDKSCED